MKKKNEKIFFLGMIALVIIGFIYLQNTNSLFNFIFEQFTQVNWDEVKTRDIVKNSIPIYLLEEQDAKCKVDARKFDLIIDHQFFVRSDELVRELNYDRENETLLISCELLKGEKSRLNVWYALEEAEKHSKKYEYFVTVWEESQS